MALAAAINMQPMKKIRTLQTVKLTIGFLASAVSRSHQECRGTQLVQSLAAGLQSLGSEPEVLARQSLFVISNCLFGMPQTDSTMEGDRFAEPQRSAR